MSFLKVCIFLFVTLITLCSCATSYKSIHPEQISYTHTPQDQGISFNYQPDVLAAAGNKKLAKKEDKFEIRVIAIKLTNNTGTDLNFTEDLELLVGTNSVEPLHPREISSSIKQWTASYLLYLLLTPVKLAVKSQTGDVSVYSVGYVLGPGTAAVNMGIAATSNNSFEEELVKYDLYNKTIANGETVYGLIGLSNYNFSNISVRLKN